MTQPGQTRRLAAILAADVVGYSRLVGEDEAGTLAAVQSCIDEVVKPQLAAHNGRLVKLMGDGALAEFGSVVDAVRCASAIQADMASRDPQDPEDANRIQLRIGVNLGDIIFENDDIFGDGVILAARLEGIAEPGGICVSRTVADQVGTKASVFFHPMGPQTLKNIAEPVEAFRAASESAPTPKPHRTRTRVRYALLVLAVLGVAVAWWMTRPDFTPADPAKMMVALPAGPSIAVLPFDYLGPDKEANGYIADGLSENIISALARIPDTLVIARNSTFTYKGKAVDVRTVSETFGVRYVLEGSVQLSGETIRVTAQLVDGIDGRHVWTDIYDRKTGDIFAVQDQITLAVANSIIARTVTGRDVATFRETDNLEAWSSRLSGYEQMLAYSPEGIKRAMAFYQKAIELDPDYSLAYSALAIAHAFEARFGYSPDPDASARTAIEFADKALALDPDNSYAYVAKAMSHLELEQPEEALAFALKGVEVAPSDGFSVGFAATVLKFSGEAQRSLPHFARARRIFVATPWWVVVEEFGALIIAGEFEAAKATADDMVERGPPFARAVWLAYSVLAFAGAGDEAEARRRVAEILTIDPDFSIRAMRRWDDPFIDKSIPERHVYAVLRKYGIPDNPPSGG